MFTIRQRLSTSIHVSTPAIHARNAMMQPMASNVRELTIHDVARIAYGA